MTRHAAHPDTDFESHGLWQSPWRGAATCRQRRVACDDDDFDDEDWDSSEMDPATDPLWDPLGLDDDEPQPEYGDFWDEPDERED
jgi:hypothetical protein